MPNPKRKHSKQRRDKRRTHDKAVVPTTAKCSIVDRPYYTIVFARNVGITVENLRLKKQLLLKKHLNFILKLAW